MKQQINFNGVQKIAVIGNAGAGKTSLSRALSRLHQLPLTHVDSVQFLSKMKIRPYQESIAILNAVQAQSAWIIDGYGPLDILESRLQAADVIVMIDFPLWRHYFWCTKRQIQNLYSTRPELPKDADEATWSHTVKLFKTLWRVHKQMRPELLRILQREGLRKKVLVVHTLRQWNQLFKKGVGPAS